MIEKCFNEAKNVLKENATKHGIMAGREWYKDVWGRDALISSLGMSASEDDELIALAEKTITSVAKFQKDNGQLPNKFDAFGRKLCFGEGGCVDTSLWYPIAVLNHYRNTGNKKFLKTHAKKAEKAITWASCLDQNNDTLLETHEGADWMDLLIRSGRVLYDQVVYYKGMQAVDEMMGILGNKRPFTTHLKILRKHINVFFWPHHENHGYVNETFGHTGIEKDFETVLNHGEKDYYYAEVGFRKFDPRFDVFANVLAVIFDVADSEKSARILSQVEQHNAAHPFPVKVLSPPINGDFFRPFYFRWTELPHLQQPGNYHNGGIWPFAGGFYVMALKKTEGDWHSALARLAEANRIGKNAEWEFNEWLTADGVPMGSAYQSWSAAVYILAHEYVRKKSKLWWLSPF